MKNEHSAETPVISKIKNPAIFSSKAQYIVAADLLKKDIITFQLPGELGEFLGELERHMLGIALVN